jgi:hypothetical protein
VVRINLNKAKEIAHERRRIAREKEMKPFDNIIAKQIPGQDSVNAENQRKILRIKYDRIQEEIDNAIDIASLKEVTSQFMPLL